MAQEIEKTAVQPSSVQPSSAALAFLGDSVFELYIRSRIVSTHDESADALNRRSKALTNAKAQARMADHLQEMLTPEELAIYKRGRNFKSVTAPRSCTISEYRRATGLEALMGSLFLQGREERIRELMEAGVAAVAAGESSSQTEDADAE